MAPQKIELNHADWRMAVSWHECTAGAFSYY